MAEHVQGIAGAVVVVLALTTGVYAAGNLASQPTRLETVLDGAGDSWTGNDFALEVGKYYIWEISSEAGAEALIQAPELFRNAWFNQVVINDKEIHSSGALHGLEFAGAGTISIGFVPMNPGEYAFFAPGHDALTGTFHVTGDGLATAPEALPLAIDTAKLAFSQGEFELETGKAYRLDVTSDGLEELAVVAPELFRNAWIDKLTIDELGVRPNGAFSSIEFDDEGTIAVTFVPIRPGNYAFYSPGFEEAGLTGTFVVR